MVEGAVCAESLHLCLNIQSSEKVSDVVEYVRKKCINDI